MGGSATFSILYFLSDLSIVTLEHDEKNHILSGALEGDGHFFLAILEMDRLTQLQCH